MRAQIHTITFRGIETIAFTVQICIANGLPAMAIVGLADKVVAESRKRVPAALAPIELALPPKRITVNLAPANVLKEGAHFDLPIAFGLLVAMGVMRLKMRLCLANWHLMGQSSLYQVSCQRQLPRRRLAVIGFARMIAAVKRHGLKACQSSPRLA